MQALKESNPSRTEDLRSKLVQLCQSLQACRVYCEAGEPKALDYPFQRSEAQVADTLYILYPNPQTQWTVNKTDDASATQVEVVVGQVTESFILGPHQVPRLFNGLWQLSSPAWGAGSARSQEAALAQLVRAGFTAADMADHYVRTNHLMELMMLMLDYHREMRSLCMGASEIASHHK
jgi:hypothetical protein